VEKRSIVIVGAGIFGVSAALELRRRGWTVTVMDPGPIPRPLAASTDISKAVRMDYGSDEHYMALMEAAFEGWDVWNRGWGAPLYHEDGFLFLAGGPMEPGGFEYESFRLLLKRGHSPRRIDSMALVGSFPAWATGRYPDGYFNPKAGWVESGAVLEKLAGEALRRGVRLLEGKIFGRLVDTESRVTGVATTSGEVHRGDVVLVAAGAWTPALLPYLEEIMWATAQTILHFRVADLERWRPPRFVPWGADIARTGWYGFPALLDGTLKVANHGPGRLVDPDEPRLVPSGEEERFREFFRASLPGLADCPLIGERVCFYCDTFDGDFWIARDPDRPGLVVAAGDSGHAFKFAPFLGPIIADVVEERPNPWASRFGWRRRGEIRTEDARCF
jgi:glycine/D-amino acid oxidase-like deaminating enzyme